MTLKAEIESCVSRSDTATCRTRLFFTPTPEHHHRGLPAAEAPLGQANQGESEKKKYPEPTTTPPFREAGYRALLNTGDSHVNASGMQLSDTDRQEMSASFGKRQAKSEGAAHDPKTPVTGYQISKEQSLRCQCLELRERVNSIRELQIQKDDSLRELTNKINKLMTKMPSYEQFGGYGLAALALSSVLTGVCARELIADKAWQDIQHLGRHWPQCMTLVCLMALTAMIAHFVYHTRLPVHIESNIPSEEAGLHQEGFGTITPWDSGRD